MINGEIRIRLVEYPIEVIEVSVSRTNHNRLVPVVRRGIIRARSTQDAISLMSRDWNKKEPRLFSAGGGDDETIVQGYVCGNWRESIPPCYIYSNNDLVDGIIIYCYWKAGDGPKHIRRLPLCVYDSKTDSYHRETRRERKERLKGIR